MSKRQARAPILSFVAVACTLGLVGVTVAVASAAPPAIPKAKGLPAPKGGSTAIPLPKPKPAFAESFSTIALRVERAFEIRGAVQHFAKGKAYVRMAYRGGKPEKGHQARVSRFDGGRRSETWLVPLSNNASPMAILPETMFAPLSALGGSYMVAIVDVREGRQLTDEVPVLSAPVGPPIVGAWRATSSGLWRYYERRDAPPRDGVYIDVELTGLNFLPSQDVAVLWELTYVPAEVVVVKGAKPTKTMLSEVVQAGRTTSWNAGRVTFRVPLPTAILPQTPRQGQEWNQIVWDKLLQHTDLTLSVIQPSTGRVLAGPTVANAWRSRPPEPPAPDTDHDGDGAHGWEYGGTDCDDDDARRSPNLTEVCDADGVDEDCDPTTIAGSRGDGDADGDGFIAWRCCNDRAGWQQCGTDCNDLDPQINPHKQDICNGIDDDCDGQIDEGLLNCPTNPPPSP